MGRKRKHLTEEDLHEAKKIWWMNYYLKNKEVVKEKNKKRYHAKKSDT